MAMDMMLSPQQEKFCLAYLEAESASEAYRIAYPTSRKWKDNAVHVNASKLLADARIMLRIKELRAEVAARTTVSEARVVEEVARIGLLDPSRMFDERGNLLPITQMPAEVRAAIASFEVVEVPGEDGGTLLQVKKVKLVDKNSALEKLMKHLGMFEKDNAQKTGMFDNVPRDTLRMIEDKLRGLQHGSGMAGQPAAGSPSRFTH